MNIQACLNNTSNWRGRAQQIIALQQKVDSLSIFSLDSVHLVAVDEFISCSITTLPLPPFTQSPRTTRADKG